MIIRDSLKNMFQSVCFYYAKCSFFLFLISYSNVNNVGNKMNKRNDFFGTLIKSRWLVRIEGRKNYICVYINLS